MEASNEDIASAVAVLRAGGIVAVPTETVYGLAADATNAGAVAQIYRAKGRPDFNPLIVHVYDLAVAQTLAVFGEYGLRLAAAFWPGPLTLVLPKRDDCPVVAAVTAGLDTIALRIPAHPLMRELLRQSGLALAAPSANISGAISPTTVAHVRAGLGNRASMILDGGACEAGVESTIIALDPEGWRLLRPGPIAEAAIAELIGPAAPAKDEGIRAPGQLARHYAPSKPLRLNAAAAYEGEYLIGFGARSGAENLSLRGDLAEAASHLFAALHRAEASDYPAIAVVPIPHDGLGIAINERLSRAAHRD
ncbi:MAG: L-threonylcarbamoyladenylate synthase [Parasphingorhabdus sp.]|nr:L-threonylcarbamoyladenylate synthase [Parasphingorhabdus sp.]